MSCQWTVALRMRGTYRWRRLSLEDVRTHSKDLHSLPQLQVQSKGFFIETQDLEEELNILSLLRVSFSRFCWHEMMTGTKSPLLSAPVGVFQQMLQARRQPKLIVKLKSANSRTRTQLRCEAWQEINYHRVWTHPADYVIHSITRFIWTLQCVTD